MFLPLDSTIPLLLSCISLVTRSFHAQRDIGDRGRRDRRWRWRLGVPALTRAEANRLPNEDRICRRKKNLVVLACSANGTWDSNAMEVIPSLLNSLPNYSPFVILSIFIYLEAIVQFSFQCGYCHLSAPQHSTGRRSTVIQSLSCCANKVPLRPPFLSDSPSLRLR